MADVDVMLVFGGLLIVGAFFSGWLLWLLSRDKTPAPVGPAPGSAPPPAWPPPAPVPPTPPGGRPVPYWRQVWIAVDRVGVIAHDRREDGYTTCRWLAEGFGDVILAGEAHERLHVGWCKQCFPPVPVMPGRLP